MTVWTAPWGLYIGVTFNNERHTLWVVILGIGVALNVTVTIENRTMPPSFRKLKHYGIDRFWVPNVTDKRKGPNYV